MRTSTLAAQLRPFIQRWDAGTAPPNWGAHEANYILYVDSGTCYARNVVTGNIDYQDTNHAAVIQSAADAAGEGGVLAFRAGIYTLNAAINLGTRHYRQTWWMQSGTRYRPGGNNSILSISNLSYFSLHGTLYIEDPSGLTTSVPALAIENLIYAYFERIFISNYYRGINMTGTTGGTNENAFNDIYMQVRDRGLSLETSCHDNHFNHIWIKGPSPEQHATGPGLRIATGGTQGGNTFDQIEILDMQTGMDLPGAYEAWFQRVIIDNPYGMGIYIGGNCERVFFGTVWTASGGDGIVIEGNNSSPPTTYADKIYFDKVYSWLNAGYGVRFLGYSTNVVFGTLIVQRNDKGLAFEGSTNYNIIIDTLVSFENTTVGVDATGASENIFIGHAIIYDAVTALDNVKICRGVRPGTGSFRNTGVATITSGNTYTVVTHGLEATPRRVFLDPQHIETAGAYVSARDATTFTITVPSAVTADRQIAWSAESRN